MVKIVHSVACIPAGNSKESTSDMFDQESSQTYGFAPGVPEQGDANHKIVQGYTNEGLPFNIVVRSINDYEVDTLMDFIDEVVVPAVIVASAKLPEEGSPLHYMGSVYREIELRSCARIENCQFYLSVAVPYRKDNEIYIAGFNVGEAGFLLNPTDGNVRQLGNMSAKHFGSDYPGETVTLPCFAEQINPGEKLIGFTQLPEQVLEEDKAYKLMGRARKCINQNEFDAPDVFAQLKVKMNSTNTSGIVSTQTIPSSEQSHDMQVQLFNQYYNEVKNRKDACQFGPLHHRLSQLLTTVETMRNDPENSLSQLTTMLEMTEEIYDNPCRENLEAYEAMAQKFQKAKTKHKFALGSTMLAVGAAITFVAVVGPTALLTSGVLAVVGVSVALMGVGLFSYTKKRQGLKSDMLNVIKEKCAETDYFLNAPLLVGKSNPGM